MCGLWVDKVLIRVILLHVVIVLALVHCVLFDVVHTLGGALGMTELKRLRILTGKSQEDVAKATGMWRNVLSLVENGKRNATDSQRAKLAFYYGVCVEDIFDHLGFVSAAKHPVPVVWVTRLRALRLERGLTGGALCAELGLNRGQFSQVELGRLAASIPQQFKLSEYYGVPIPKLFNAVGLARMKKENS